MAYDVDAYVDFNNNHNQYMRGYMDGIQQGKKDTIEAIKKEFEKIPNRTITSVDFVLILRKLKELDDG